MVSVNVLRTGLASCATNLLTRLCRDSYCNTEPEDQGNHAICAVVTVEWLATVKRIRVEAEAGSGRRSTAVAALVVLALLVSACAEPTTPGDEAAPDTRPGIDEPNKTSAATVVSSMAGLDFEMAEHTFDEELEVEVSPDRPEPAWGTSRLGTAYRMSANGGQPRQPFTISLPATEIDAQDPELVFFARWDPEVEVWVPFVTEYDSATGIITATIDHLSIIAPFEWVGGQIVNGTRWTGRQLKQLYEGAVRGTQVAGDHLAAGLDLLGTNVAGWLGLRGAPRPDCGEGAETAAELFELSNSAAGDQPPLFGCLTSEPGSSRLTVKVSNNRPYGMVLNIPAGATVVLDSWPGIAIDSGQAGLLAFYELLQSTIGLQESYLPPGGSVNVNIDMAGRDSLLIDTTSTPAYTGFDLAVELVKAIWLDRVEDAIEVANCLLVGGPNLIEISDNFDPGNALAYYDSFVDCARVIVGDVADDLGSVAKSILSTIPALMSNLKDVSLTEFEVANSLGVTRRQVIGAPSSASPGGTSGSDYLIVDDLGPTAVVDDPLTDSGFQEVRRTTDQGETVYVSDQMVSGESERLALADPADLSVSGGDGQLIATVFVYDYSGDVIPNGLAVFQRSAGDDRWQTQVFVDVFEIESSLGSDTTYQQVISGPGEIIPVLWTNAAELDLNAVPVRYRAELTIVDYFQDYEALFAGFLECDIGVVYECTIIAN